MILKCNCKHHQQDKIHGTGNRVMNEKTKMEDSFKCTVCGSIKTISKGK